MPDIITAQIFTDGEKGITATKMNNIIANSTIQTDFIANKPAGSALNPSDQLLELTSGGTYARITGAQLASSVAGQLSLANTSQSGMLRQTTGNTTDFLDGTNNYQNLTTAIGSSVTNVRLRSYNALAFANGNFEVDQVNVGGVVAGPGTGTRIIDRWFIQKSGTMVVSAGQRPAAASEVLVPGTNFAISRAFHRLTVTTAQASLGAGDNLTLYTQLEGPQFRELQYDVHSISLLVRSSVAGLSFGVSVRDPGATSKSWVGFCTIASANTWTLVTLPSITVFPSGNFSTAPGVLGYLFSICLACGTTLTTPVNGSWQNGNYIGAIGQSNLAATLNATFDVAFVQHEPGPPTQLMDLDFSTNLDRCLRYLEKSWDYSIKPGSTGYNGCIATYAQAFSHPWFPIRFKKVMAKAPTVTSYSPNTGAANNVWDNTTSGSPDRTVSATNSAGTSGFSGFTITAAPTVLWNALFHYTADSGW